MTGSAADVLRFFAWVAQAPYETLLLRDLRLGPGEPSFGQADLMALTVKGRTAPSESGGGSIPSGAGDSGPLADLESQFTEALAAGNWAKAIACGERVLASAPDRADVVRDLYRAHVEWGREFSSTGRMAEAAGQFEEALFLIPDGVEALAEWRRLQQASATREWPGPAPESPPATMVHVVHPGDTLSSLARLYDTTVEEIMAMNGLLGTTIYVGQELAVPLHEGE